MSGRALWSLCGRGQRAAGVGTRVACSGPMHTRRDARSKANWDAKIPWKQQDCSHCTLSNRRCHVRAQMGPDPFLPVWMGPHIVHWFSSWSLVRSAVFLSPKFSQVLLPCWKCMNPCFLGGIHILMRIGLACGLSAGERGCGLQTLTPGRVVRGWGDLSGRALR